MSDIKYLLLEVKHTSIENTFSVWKIEMEGLFPTSARTGIYHTLSRMAGTTADISNFIANDQIHDRDVMEMVHGKQLVDVVGRLLPHLRNIGQGLWLINSTDNCFKTAIAMVDEQG